MEMVQQAVAHHHAKARANAPGQGLHYSWCEGQQSRTKRQPWPPMGMALQALGGEIEHGRRTVEAQHLGLGEAIHQPKADIAGSTTQVDDPQRLDLASGPQQLRQPLHQGLVSRTEIGRPIGLGLGEALH